MANLKNIYLNQFLYTEIKQMAREHKIPTKQMIYHLLLNYLDGSKYARQYDQQTGKVICNYTLPTPTKGSQKVIQIPFNFSDGQALKDIASRYHMTFSHFIECILTMIVDDLKITEK